MRQQGDEVFQSMLNELRLGVCGPDTYERLKGLLLTEADVEDASPIRPTILYSLRKDVDLVNRAEYQQVLVAGGENKEKIYKTRYEGVKGGLAAKPMAKKWAENIGIPDAVTLCVGAQVVVTANVDVENGIINGSRGIVTRLGDCPEIQLLDGRLISVEPKRMIDDSNKLVVHYCPLQYAWALTINKSQGMTLDKAIIDLGSSVFASGQAYTALSRVRNLSSVRLMGLSKKSFRLSQEVVEFIEGI
jgi:ATP-dependent DNA helicase PIF1